MNKQYRHELKHEISRADLLVIRQRMRAIARPDPHAVNGRYLIRSLYFDNLNDKALREKIDGVNGREKWRIRYYNLDPHSVIHLEKKSRLNGLGTKYSASLSYEEAERILHGDIDWMMQYADSAESSALTGFPESAAPRASAKISGEPGAAERPLLKELYCKMRYQGMRPRTIVDYTREPFIYDAGNVRVTLDYDIRTGLRNTDFLDPDCVTIPAGDAPAILEVKWDNYLPSVIQDAVQLPNRRAAAFSKYAQCRIYG